MEQIVLNGSDEFENPGWTEVRFACGVSTGHLVPPAIGCHRASWELGIG
jgi:hypothetical protein